MANFEIIDNSNYGNQNMFLRLSYEDKNGDYFDMMNENGYIDEYTGKELFDKCASDFQDGHKFVHLMISIDEDEAMYMESNDRSRDGLYRVLMIDFFEEVAKLLAKLVNGRVMMAMHEDIFLDHAHYILDATEYTDSKLLLFDELLFALKVDINCLLREYWLAEIPISRRERMLFFKPDDKCVLKYDNSIIKCVLRTPLRIWDVDIRHEFEMKLNKKDSKG